MDYLIYLGVRTLVALFQALPIEWVARIGRIGGAVVYLFDRRHGRITRYNLNLIYGAEKSPAELRALARKNYRNIGEVYCCILKTAAMPDAEVREIMEVRGLEKLPARGPDGKWLNRVIAGGHFGNFELGTRASAFLPGYQGVATYRGIASPRLNQLLIDLRTVSGNLLYDRRAGADELRLAMAEGGKLLTLAVDQADRKGGIELPFLGYYAWTSRSAAVLAQRYDCDIFTAVSYRVALARWVVEIGDPIPTVVNGVRRSAADIMRDVNAALEVGVRRDPANWFWVHNRWKTKDGKPPRRVET
jgi:KDO2-lipid IV(A) lauroyltransferase